MGMSKQDIEDEGKKAEEEKQAKLDAMAALQPPSMFGKGNEQNAQDGEQNADKTGANAPANNQTIKKGKVE